MFGSKPSTSEQQHKEQITKHLRAADEFFRYNRFDEGLVQIDQALAIDPKNVLARSFRERIIMMQKRSASSSGLDAKTGLSEDEKGAITAKLLAEAEELIKAQNYKMALNKVSEVYRADPKNFFARAYSDRIEELQQQQKKEAEKFFAKPAPAPAAATVAPPVKSGGSNSMYRELMREVWFDGKVTPEEEIELKKVRDIFNISNKEHFDIEREVKLNAYVEALKLVWRDGVLTANERETLEIMRKRYDINTDEHHALESKIQEAKKGTPTKATVLLVDPERDHITPLIQFLKEHHYDVIPALRVEDAFQKIVNHFPQLVLTEIVFTSSQLDGFSLFEKLQQHQTLKHVPFFFMSRIKDDKVIRAALRLGLDLHFTKPVDHDLLLAAIEGRLRKH
ncbi:MAG: response regulator [Bacteroidota bacterium]